MTRRAAAPEAPSRLADVGRGLAGLVALALLLVGVPAGLWALAGWPLPSAVPSWSDVTGALGDSYIPDTFLAKALAAVCWLVWLELVASVVVEAVAVARGRTAADVPLAGPVQRMAGRLVGAASLLVLIAVARPEGAPDLAAPLHVRPPAPAIQSLEVDLPVDDAAPELAHPTYTVAHRDTLWDIAERHLHDPFRWTEIWELNRGTVQADGATFSDPDLICPGWELRLPVDAEAPAPAPAAATVEGPPAGAEVMAPLGPAETETVLIAERPDNGGPERMTVLPDDARPVDR